MSPHFLRNFLTWKNSGSPLIPGPDVGSRAGAGGATCYRHDRMVGKWPDSGVYAERPGHQLDVVASASARLSGARRPSCRRRSMAIVVASCW